MNYLHNRIIFMGVVCWTVFLPPTALAREIIYVDALLPSGYVADLPLHDEPWRELEEYAYVTPGDLDGDGVYTTADIDALQRSIRKSEWYYAADVNADGMLSNSDVDSLLALAGGLRGDAALNGIVNLSDFLQVSSHFDGRGGWSEGDFTGDEWVLFDDFIQVSANFGTTIDRIQIHPAAVPEPSGLGLAIACLLISACCRKS